MKGLWSSCQHVNRAHWAEFQSNYTFNVANVRKHDRKWICISLVHQHSMFLTFRLLWIYIISKL